MQWGVHLFPTQGEVGDLFEPKPYTAARNHPGSPALAALQLSCTEAAVGEAGRWEQGWHSSLPRLPGAFLALTVAHPQLLGALEWQQSPQAVVWDLQQLPTSGCCHSCPHHGPRANCKDEMVVELSGLSWSHPFVLIHARTILQGGGPSL